jgi:hypothetical protein
MTVKEVPSKREMDILSNAPQAIRLPRRVVKLIKPLRRAQQQLPPPDAVGDPSRIGPPSPPGENPTASENPRDPYEPIRTQLKEFLAKKIPNYRSVVTINSPLIQGMLLGFTAQEVRGLENAYRLRGEIPHNFLIYHIAQRRQELIHESRPKKAGDSSSEFEDGYRWANNIFGKIVAAVPSLEDNEHPYRDTLDVEIQENTDRVILEEMGVTPDEIARSNRNQYGPSFRAAEGRRITAARVGQRLVYVIVSAR